MPRTQLGRHGQLLGAGLRTAQLQPRHFIATPWKGARLPAQGGFIELEGDALCTSICNVDGATEVRLFNPTEDSITAHVKLADGPTNAQQVDLESQPLGDPAPLKDAIKLRAKEIVTLRLS